MWHKDRLMTGTRVRMTFRSTPDHREDADGNRDAVELQRFAVWHWAQLPLKLGSCAALVLLHVVVLGRLRGAALGPGTAVGGAGARRWRWSGTVLGPGCWRRAVALWFLLYDSSMLYASDE